MVRFVCKRCGKEHPAVLHEPVPVDEAKRAVLRAAWQKAAETPSSTEADVRELKTSLAYFGTFEDGVPRLPTTVTTEKTNHGFVLVCSERCS